jgi:hypothetical protein
MQPAPGIGHNRPTIAELFADTMEFLPEHLRDTSAEIRERALKLGIQVEEFPGRIDDGNEEMAGAAQALIKDLRAAVKTADTLREGAKEPVLEAGRLIDGHFKAGIMVGLDKAKAGITRILTDFHNRKRVIEKRARDEEARRQRDAAHAARREADAQAEAARTEKELQDAVDAEREADLAAAKAAQSTKKADAGAADLSRTRAPDGTVGSLRTWWDWEGFDRDRLDLEALRQHLPEKALHQAVDSFVKAGGRGLNGVARIFQQHESVVR